LPLPRDLQWLTAGGEQAQGGAGREEMVSEGGTGIDQVLAVVEDEERGLGSEDGVEGFEGGSARRFLQTEGGGDGDGEEGGIGDGREFDEPEALWEEGEEIGGEGEGEAGLAATTDAGESEEALIGVEDEMAQGGEGVVTPDERGTRGR